MVRNSRFKTRTRLLLLVIEYYCFVESKYNKQPEQNCHQKSYGQSLAVGRQASFAVKVRMTQVDWSVCN